MDPKYYTLAKDVRAGDTYDHGVIKEVKYDAVKDLYQFKFHGAGSKTISYTSWVPPDHKLVKMTHVGPSEEEIEAAKAGLESWLNQ